MTKQACIIQHLTLELDHQKIFSDLNFQLPATKITALTGRNGQGKSLLIELLSNNPSFSNSYTGHINWQVQYAKLSQLHRIQAKTIAEALEIDIYTTAFQRIENASAHFNDYDIVDGKWHLLQEWRHILANADLPISFDYSIDHLSEGQKTKLALCRLFLLKDHYLLLDEPSNHLDQNSRKWLLTCLQQHTAGALIVSHDLDLLESVDCIFELNQLGLQQYSGHYSDFSVQKTLQINSLEKQHEFNKSELKRIQLKQHATRMKAEKRQHSGKKLRDGSQHKMFLDMKMNSAQKTLNHVKKQQTKQSEELHVSIEENKSKLEIIKPQMFEFASSSIKKGEILRLKQIQLIYGSSTPISFSLHAGQKIHLNAANGTGKSTLLKTIQQDLTFKGGEIFKNVQSIYLNQQFYLNDHASQFNVLSYLNEFNPDIKEVSWRNLLGQLRIRNDKVFQTLEQLSGGERLKVTLLGMSQSKLPFELLLLDEPDNHLDIESKQLLASAIKNYQGAIILVSHDQAFVDLCEIHDQFTL